MSKRINAEKGNSMDKIKAIDPKIVVNGNVDKPYYSIEYYDTADNTWHIGYGSFELKNVTEWLRTCFDVIKSDVAPVRHGNWVCNKGLVQCNICGFGLFPDGYFFENGECTHSNEQDYRFSYCPNCGAKMDRSKNG
jgi:hypothetical protein